ncbi:hypothetical protein, conserved [Trypanosoma brucei brucei TREU927]|uniref:T. brucei spp.-specific protein n=1 Tax=Trypanosoma brucei brucei (strain 927/4 GUTat10.1) TaxID=185431 RepID=Q381A4_TRYB2|nr:hypothetical protein, conserved [Trypanosoma brucei brucei TREU927]EAN80627.1 hypothetical protein, conserved [Trypanosoma brucei brucei TREU927]
MTFFGLMRLFGRGSAVSSVEPLGSEESQQSSPSESQQHAPEYLEIDYEQEMEECSRYTFSTGPLQSSDPRVDIRMLEGLRFQHQHQHQKQSQQFEAGNALPPRCGLRERFASDGYDCISLRLLLGEARRLHLARCGGMVTEVRRQWREFATNLAEELGQLSFEQVRRNIACARLFDLTSLSSSTGAGAGAGGASHDVTSSGNFTLYCGSGGGAERVRALQYRKERLLQKLRERKTLFWTGDDELPCETQTHHMEQGEEQPFTSDSGAVPPAVAVEGLESRRKLQSNVSLSSSVSGLIGVGAFIKCRDESGEGLSVGLTSYASSCVEDVDDDDSVCMGDDIVTVSSDGFGYCTPLGLSETGLLTAGPGG